MLCRSPTRKITAWSNHAVTAALLAPGPGCRQRRENWADPQVPGMPHVGFHPLPPAAAGRWQAAGGAELAVLRACRQRTGAMPSELWAPSARSARCCAGAAVAAAAGAAAAAAAGAGAATPAEPAASASRGSCGSCCRNARTNGHQAPASRHRMERCACGGSAREPTCDHSIQ